MQMNWEKGRERERESPGISRGSGKFDDISRKVLTHESDR